MVEGRSGKGVDPAQHREVIAVISILVAGSAISWLRLPALGRNTLWAEDGTPFISDWLSDPSWTVLFRPYAGYQHLLPRIASGLVTLLPVDAWADAATIAACVLAGCVAALCFVATRTLVPDIWARLGIAAVPVFAPMLAIEAIANLANVHWYLLYLMAWLFFVKPRSKCTAVAWSIVSAASCLTEIQCLIFAPLAGWLLLKGTRSRAAAIGWVIGIGIQAITFLSQGRRRSAGLPPADSTVKGYLFNVVWGSFNGYAKPAQWIAAYIGWGLFAFMFATVVIAAGAAACLGSRQLRLALLTVLLASIGTWCLSYVYNNESTVAYADPPFLLVRWGTGGAMLLASIFPLLAGALAEHQPRWRRFSLLMVICMVAVMLLSFSHSNEGRQAPKWAIAVAAARATCSVNPSASVEVPITPEGWSVLVHCSRIG